ncbi:MAG TPA: hypothetical protein VFL97_04475 [Nitrococcus sp.]|nr:hypothetical protein [Nitrococcus sp.]
MRTEDANKKFRRWPPRVKRRRPHNPPTHSTSETAKPHEAEPQSGSDKPVRISYRSRRLPTRDSGGA